MRHGPHHAAQKSTTTGTSAPLTSSSKVSLVRGVMLPIGSWPPGWRAVAPLDQPTETRLVRSSFLGFEPMLGVDGGHAAAARRRDCLPVDVVLHVAACEDTRDV